jgi:hypothetical protein
MAHDTRDWRAAVIADLRSWAADGPIHGSLVRRLMSIHCAPGALIDSHTAEQILDASGLEPMLEAGPKPTPSQTGWAGLQFRRHPGYVAGCKEQFGFRLRG